MKSFKIASTQIEKIAWLLKHQELWGDIPLATDALNDQHKNRLMNILVQMRNEGLYKKHVGIKQLNLLPVLRKASSLLQTQHGSIR